MLTVALVAAAAMAGYWTGRVGLGGRLHYWAERLCHWADRQGRNGRNWRDWRLWVAQPILAAAIAWMWTVHPRRTRANVRANRAWLNAPRSPAVRIPTTTEETS